MAARIKSKLPCAGISLAEGLWMKLLGEYFSGLCSGRGLVMELEFFLRARGKCYYSYGIWNVGQYHSKFCTLKYYGIRLESALTGHRRSRVVDAS
eukprot:872982-Pleurochrysis_carterae.AAC.5